MSPWSIIGWFVVIVCIVIPVLAFLIQLTVAVGKDIHASLVLRRANKGKLRCTYTEPGPDRVRCPNIATRRTARGFACEEHIHSRFMQGSTVSFAFPLDFTKS